MNSYKIFELQLFNVHKLSCLLQLLQDLTKPCGQQDWFPPGLTAGSVLKPWESQTGKLSWKDLSVFNNILVGFLKALCSKWFCAKDFLWVYISLKCMVSSSHNSTDSVSQASGRLLICGLWDSYPQTWYRKAKPLTTIQLRSLCSVHYPPLLTVRPDIFA